MKKIIFTVACIICLSSILSGNVHALSDKPLGFYCVRNKEHKQPSLGGEMSFIEQYDAYYVDKAHGDTAQEKVIYLTFDAGYENGNIEKILDVMKSEGVTGTFFILENLIVKNPDLVRRMANEGHTVGNHTCRHKDMTTIDSIEAFSAELEALNRLYEETTGCKMAKYYRPPEGKFDERSLSYAQQLGYKTVFWSFAYADWDNDKQPSRDAAMKKIMENIHNGEVMLLHPTSSTNAAILCDLIRELKSQGYRFGDIDELVSK